MAILDVEKQVVWIVVRYTAVNAYRAEVVVVVIPGEVILRIVDIAGLREVIAAGHKRNHAAWALHVVLKEAAEDLLVILSESLALI